MNKVVLKKDGMLHINGVEVSFVKGFSIKSRKDGSSIIVAEFEASVFEVEVGVDDFAAGATPQSEIAPRNIVIQAMIDNGFTFKEAIDALENSKTTLNDNLRNVASRDDTLAAALYSDWQS